VQIEEPSRFYESSWLEPSSNWFGSAPVFDHQMKW